MESGCLQKEIGKVTHIKCLTSPPRFSPQETFGGDFGTVICLHDKPNKMMIDGNFKITTDQLTLTFTEGQRQDFFIRHTPHRVEIIYPPQTDFEHLQPWLFKVVTEALRKQAKAIHPAQHQFGPYTLGKLLQQRTYQPVAISDDSPSSVIRLRTAPRALPHPRDEPRPSLLDLNGQSDPTAIRHAQKRVAPLPVSFPIG